MLQSLFIFYIYDLFPLINLCLVDTLLTRDVGIHIWTKLKKGRILRYGSNPPRNPEQLWDQVVEIWDNLAQNHEYCLILVDTLLRRCQAVIDAGGMWKRYCLFFFFFFALNYLFFFLLLEIKLIFLYIIIYFTLLCRANPQVLSISFSSPPLWNKW